MSDQNEALLFGPFRLLPGQQLLLEGDTPVPLGARAFELLLTLACRSGKVVSNEDLIKAVWRGMSVEDSNVRVHVAGLRRALRDGQDGARYVMNIPGRGYSFVAPVQRVRAGPGAPVEAARPPSPLPRSATRVIGRGPLIEALCAQLASRRFLTLVGPGGIGKTTVALAVASQLAASYRDGVCFVDFSSVRNPELVPSTIAAALGLAVPNQHATPAILAHLGAKELLLVLDNCEHVIETAANAAEQVATGAAGVHVLSTSREPLRAAGERIHRLLPLESPPRSAGLTAEEALAFPCVQLFMERVGASMDGYRLTDADAPLAAEICNRLDGIALAVELAASRVAAFGMRELAARLDDRFRLLTSGRRTALPRHQTLTATLDWSYELLPAGEQMLLRRLSIFAGDFSLEAAAAVIPSMEAAPVFTDIADLVSKSLVVADRDPEGTRYRLLESTRLYAAEKLHVGDDYRAVRRAHAAHVRDLFTSAEADAQSMPTQRWRAKYAAQVDNLRAALDWAGSPAGDPALYLSLAMGAVPLWVHLSLMGECRMWVERGLAMLGEGPDAAETKMRLSAALGWSLMYSAGRASEIGATWAATLRLAETLGDTSHQLRAIWGIWIGKLNSGDLDAALGLASRLLDLVRGSPDDTDVMMADRLMATTLHYRGDQGGARMHIERMFARYSVATARPKIASFHVDQKVTARYFHARILWLQGCADQALSAVQQNIREGEALGHALSFASVMGQAACPISLFTGDLVAARRYGSMLLDHAERHALQLWHDWAACFIGLVTIKDEDPGAGLDVMRAAFEKAGDSRFLPRYMPLLAEYAAALGHAGERRLGLETIERMLDRCARTGERWYEPELLRLRGELLALDGEDCQAGDVAAQFTRSMRLAEQQGARAWQLRAAISLVRHENAAGDAGEARRQLSLVYATFTEGFDTSDMQQASRLLSSP